MSSWRSSNIDEMVLAAFTKKGPLPPKEEAHWRVLRVASFVTVYEAFVGMEPYVGFFWRIFSGASLVSGEAVRDYVDGGLCPRSRSDQTIHEVL